jgi:glutathione S-transferase
MLTGAVPSAAVVRADLASPFALRVPMAAAFARIPYHIDYVVPRVGGDSDRLVVVRQRPGDSATAALPQPMGAHDAMMQLLAESNSPSASNLGTPRSQHRHEEPATCGSSGNTDGYVAIGGTTFGGSLTSPSDSDLDATVGASPVVPMEVTTVLDLVTLPSRDADQLAARMVDAADEMTRALRRALVVTSKAPRLPATLQAVAEHKTKAREHLKRLEGLVVGPCAMGTRPTYVDAVLVPHIAFYLQALHGADIDLCPNLWRLYEQACRNSAVRELLEEYSFDDIAMRRYLDGLSPGAVAE